MTFISRIAEPLWRAVRRIGGIQAALRRTAEIVGLEGIQGLLRRLRRTVREEIRYEDWIERFDDNPEANRAIYEQKLQSLEARPLFSIVMPAFETPEELLEAAILSVREQVYPNWELCICDDGSASAHVTELLERISRDEPRLRWTRLTENQNISAASNAALALGTGDWVIPFDHDDLLRPHALLEVAFAIAEAPAARFVYSDEDKIDAAGAKRSEPHFKPDWSPDLLRSYNYINHLSAMRREDVLAVGAWTPGLEGAQDHDLYLKITETLRRDQIVHIPKVLYHWRVTAASTASSGMAKPYALNAMEKAVVEHLQRTGRAADVSLLDGFPMARLRYRLPSPAPLASIIIPNKDKPELIKACVASIREKTRYAHYEIVIVDNGSKDPETLRFYEEIRSYDVIIKEFNSEFNYSAMNNVGIDVSSGEILVFLNNDTYVISEEWLAELVSHAVRPEIGCVGAKLYYADDTIQHAGIFLGVGGIASHPYRGFNKAESGYFGRLRVAQNFSAVTAACLAVKRSIALQVGGFDDEAFKVALNDVDFCLKVRDAGYNNLWTPFAELYHFESRSRGYEIGPEKRARYQRESEIFAARWSGYVKADPYYSPHLSRTSEAVTIRTD